MRVLGGLKGTNFFEVFVNLSGDFDGCDSNEDDELRGRWKCEKGV